MSKRRDQRGTTESLGGLSLARSRSGCGGGLVALLGDRLQGFIDMGTGDEVSKVSGREKLCPRPSYERCR